jgi:hypothetical protein
MKKNLFRLAFFACLLASCSKSVNNKDENTGSSVVQFISVNKENDSLTTNYMFDNGYLLKEWTDASNYPAAYPEIEYTRDEQKRVIKKTAFGLYDTTITDVYYTSDNEVAYAIDHSAKDASTVIDSITYDYANGKVKRVNIFSPGTAILTQPMYYYTFEYVNSNISNVVVFSLNDDGTYSNNFGYDFEYDNKVNPIFISDDINILYHPNYASSNNITKQTNHYGSAPIDDYVIYEYIYGSDDKPISVNWSGPSISTMKGFYFYK